MLYRLRRAIARSRFERATRDLLKTPPLKRVNAPLSIVSMVANDEAHMYILAMKSFYSRLGRGHIAAIVDADMPSATRDFIESHLGPVEFITLESIQTGPCQRGGTWERILYVLERSAGEYVIQLDADTLAFGDVCEAVECANANRAFTLAEGLPVRTVAEFAAGANGSSAGHIVIEVERRFGEYPDQKARYVRGSSGFAGFARGGFERGRIEEFHVHMEKIHGARWKEWGTEQVASNFAVANSPGSLPLPNPKYGTYAGEPVPGSHFLHFIGTYRFQNGVFADLGRKVIREYSQG